MRRPQAEIDLEISGESFSPGDEVPFRASIASRKGFDVRNGKISLQCIETFWIVVSNGKSTSQKKRTETLVEVVHDFMSRGKIDRNMPHVVESSLTIPAQAPVSVHGKTARISWQLKLSMDVPGRRDLHEELPFLVRGPLTERARQRDEYSAPITIDEEFDDCDVRLELSRQELKAGESIDGRLRLEARKDVEFAELRVELERKEEAGVRKSKTTADQLVLEQDIDLRAMRSQEWRFSLTVPEGIWPSTHVSKTRIEWRLKAILARTRRRDFSVEHELRVR